VLTEDGQCHSCDRKAKVNRMTLRFRCSLPRSGSPTLVARNGKVLVCPRFRSAPAGCRLQGFLRSRIKSHQTRHHDHLFWNLPPAGAMPTRKLGGPSLPVPIVQGRRWWNPNVRSRLLLHQDSGQNSTKSSRPSRLRPEDAVAFERLLVAVVLEGGLQAPDGGGTGVNRERTVQS
jgi:hypothetical protein